MNASGGPAGTSSRSHKVRAPGTEMTLGRSSTPGRAKTLRASSSTTSRSGLCSSWVCGLVGVVLGRDPLLFGKTFMFLSILSFCAFTCVEATARSRTGLVGYHVPLFLKAPRRSQEPGLVGLVVRVHVQPSGEFLPTDEPRGFAFGQ